MLDKKEILEKLDDLYIRLTNINNWIKDNPQVKEPNMYEIVNCWCEYGECLYSLRKYYDENGYPIIVDREGNSKEETHYNVWRLDEEAKKCGDSLKEMGILRNLDNHDFVKNEIVHKFLTDLQYHVVIGEYDVPKNPVIGRIKKELLCKIMSVPLYIWQTKRSEPDYQYDNASEWMMLQDHYQHYQDEMGVQTVLSEIDKDGNITAKYQGPQFGYYIESIFEKIEKSYKYNQVPSTKKLSQ